NGCSTLGQRARGQASPTFLDGVRDGTTGALGGRCTWGLRGQCGGRGKQDLVPPQAARRDCLLRSDRSRAVAVSEEVSDAGCPKTWYRAPAHTPPKPPA